MRQYKAAQWWPLRAEGLQIPTHLIIPVYLCSEPAISLFLLIAKMAYAQPLASGRARERGRKGRKLPGEVLQCFKNLSSHSAELSGMNNRFGTWPACTRESVTAALWSGLPAFDGCAVSQNSWRRGNPAAPRRREKTTNKKQKQRFLCEADTRFWTLPEPDVSPAAWPVVPCTERSRHCCLSIRAQRSAREKMQHNPMEKAQQQLPPRVFTISCSSSQHFPSGDHLHGPLQWHH